MPFDANEANRLRVGALGRSVDVPLDPADVTWLATWTSGGLAANRNVLDSAIDERIINRLLNSYNTRITQINTGVNGLGDRFNDVIGEDSGADQADFAAIGKPLIQAVAELLSAAGITEPPDDDKLYARAREPTETEGEWREIPEAGAGIAEPPDDDKLYARIREPGETEGDWQEITGTGGTFAQVTAGNTLTVTNAVGGFPLGSTIAATDNLWDVVKRLLNPRTPPVYTQPSLSLTGSTPLSNEIGSNISPTLTPNFNAGDSGGITLYRLNRAGGQIFSNATATARQDTPAFQLTADVAYQAYADYAAGAPKPDSEGVLDPPGSGIAAGTATSNTVTYLAQRRAFYGKLMVNAVPTTEAQLRALGNDPLNQRSMAVDAINSNGVCFAYPQAWGTASSIVSSTLGNVTSAFTPTTVMVLGANGYGPAVAYYVYAATSASQATTSNVYTLTV